MKDAHGSFSYRVHSAIYGVKCNTCHRYEKLIRFSSVSVMAGEFFWLHPFYSGDLNLVIFYTLRYLCPTHESLQVCCRELMSLLTSSPLS